MKTLIIHGQSHEGSTCMVARELANKVDGEEKGWHGKNRPWK